jgi:methionyl-tRNA synthetase
MADLPGREDELRYVLCSIMPETKDSEFTWKDWQTRINSELVGIFGNFVNRAMVLCGKFHEGKVPGDVSVQEVPDSVREAWNSCAQEMQNALDAMRDGLTHYHFRDALAEMMNMARAGNKFLAVTEPWKLKDDYRTRAFILNRALQIAANLMLASEVFLPRTAVNLAAQLALNVSDEARYSFWKGTLHTDLLPEHHQLGTPALLFKQVEDEVVEKQIQKLRNMNTETTVQAGTEPQQQVKPLKDTIQYEDFAKMDIRVAKVLEAERIPKADKLLKLTLDTGLDTRTVLSGIAEHFSPEEVKGRKVLLLANLAPRKMRGIDSEGMILMAEGADGKLFFVQPDGEANAGSGVS